VPEGEASVRTRTASGRTVSMGTAEQQDSNRCFGT
jgi:hypothetical protein